MGDALLGKSATETFIRGLIITILVQSSSVTTSLVVPLVGGGILTLRQIFPYTLGANIGTTVTNTIVAMGSMGRHIEFQRAFAGATMHDFFNLLTILILFPLEQAIDDPTSTSLGLAGAALVAAGREPVDWCIPG